MRVWNKYSREYVYVSCRKCALCKSKRARFWTDKMNRESKCHPYTLFGTLTYSPEFLPILSYDREHEALVSDDGSLCFSINGKIKDYLDHDSLHYIRLNNGCLPYFRVSDMQRFVKRLRSRIASNPSGEPKSCRYLRFVFVGEYGETKLRPHMHFVFYTGSKWFAEHQQDVVSSCWSTDGRSTDKKQLGRVDCSLVKNSASSYVASYIACVDSLPKIYTFPQLRPRIVSSKHPPIGSLLGSDEEVRKLFDSGSVYRTVTGRNGEVLQCLWPQDFCDRLYPRFRGFGKVSVDVLRRLYCLSDDVLGKSFDEFFFFCENERLKTNSFLQPYFQYLFTENSNCQSNSCLHVLLSQMRRFSHQARLFNVSLDDYFDRIVDYWSRRDYALLKMQQEWKQQFVESDKSLSLFASVRFDNEFCYRVSSHSSNFKLSDYVLDCDEDSLAYSVGLPQASDPEYVHKLSMCNKVIHDGKNKHIKYEYLNSDRIDDELKNFYKYLISKKT